jgi:Arc/MetJ family transcription regulator
VSRIGLRFRNLEFACIHISYYNVVYAMKRTNIVLDEALIREGLKSTGLKTRRALVDRALNELVRRERQQELLTLKGKIHWDGDLAAMRRKRVA